MKIRKEATEKKLKRFVFMVNILLFAGCCFYGCQPQKNERASEHTDAELKMRIASNVLEHSLGEVVDIYVYIKNITNKDIIICARPSRETATFTYYEGNKVEIFEDSSEFEKPVSIEKSFITLKSGKEIFFLTMQYGPNLGGKYFNKIGKWEIKITHIHDFSGEQFGLKVWKGQLTSNVLPMVVIQKR